MAIVAIIPDKLGKLLATLQGALDPDEPEPVPPHVPLVAPFEVEPPFLPLERHCWSAGHEMSPFSVELGDLVIDDEVALAWLPVVSGAERIAALRERLLAGPYPVPAGDEPFEVRALAARVSFHDELAITKFREQTYGPGYRTLYLERFELMARYATGSWYQRDFYTLDRAVTAV